MRQDFLPRHSTQGPLAEADDIGHHRTVTRKEVEVAEAEEESPPVEETAPEMMHTMNRVLRNFRDQKLMEIETRNKGPCHEECFVRRWSNVEYSRHVAARQNTFDRIFEGADLLIITTTPLPQDRPSPRETRRPPGSKPKS
jgi:hypothetical protein